MENACPGCGYISDRPSRFCRQCGKQLYLETEASSAATRNYEPKGVQAPNLNEEIQETARFYTPPVATYHDFPEKKRSRAGMWIMIAFLSFLLVSGGIVAMVVSAFRAPRHPAATALEEVVAREMEERIREELNKARKFNPPPPPNPPGVSEKDTPDIISKYKYPNAQVDQSVSGVGSDVVKMSTSDTVETVKDFYSGISGVSPLTQSRDRDKEQIVLRTSNSPPIMIIIGPDDDLPGKTQIVLIRSGFEFPK
jgi:hypothetical protein